MRPERLPQLLYELSCRGALNVIQEVANGHKSFEVFIRYGDAEAVFDRDGQVDFGD